MHDKDRQNDRRQRYLTINAITVTSADFLTISLPLVSRCIVSYRHVLPDFLASAQ